MDAREQEIQRAIAAVQNAPRTEHGILVPPHVLEQRAAEQAAPAYKPNREQRRRNAKRERQEAKRLAKLTGPQRDAVSDAVAAFGKLDDAQQTAALAILRQPNAKDVLEQLSEQLADGGDAAHD